MVVSRRLALALPSLKEKLLPLFWGIFELIGSKATTLRMACNENGKKTIGLDKQNNNFAGAWSHFSVHFFALVGHQDVILPNFTFSGGHYTRQQFSGFFFQNLRYSPLEFIS